MAINGVRKYAVLTLALVCWASVNHVHAQSSTPRSLCEDGGNNPVPCYFDVSLTLTNDVVEGGFNRFFVERSFRLGDLGAPIAWDPRSDDELRSGIEQQLGEFAETWCTATSGLSKINKITLYTDGRLGDFRLINAIGRAAARVGFFRPRVETDYFRAAAVVYRYRQVRFPGEVLTEYLGVTMAHEFAHAALKVPDEYAEADPRPGDSCLKPLESDNRRETIMSDHTEWKRFSTAEDYDEDPTPQTAQYRCYGKSAWETMVQSPADDPVAIQAISAEPRRQYFDQIPSTVSNTPEPSWGCEVGSDELEELVIWASDARRVVLLIDRSGSMTGAAIAEAIGAAQEVVNLIAIESSPIQVAVVGFGDRDAVETRLDLTVFGDQPVDPIVTLYDARILNAHAEIARLTAGGGTDFQAGLDHVRTLLESAVPGDAQSVVLMLSDGQADTPDTSYFRDNDVPVHTVGIGYVDVGVMQEIAADTGGSYRSGTLANLRSIFNRILRDFSMVNHNQIITSGERSLSAFGFFPRAGAFEAVISGMSESVNFVLRWKPGATLEAFTLTRPDGVMIDETSAVGRDVNYLEVPFQASYSVRFPSSGVWTMALRGDGDFTYEVAAYSLITAGVSAGAAVLPRASKQTVVTYPEPIPIVATVSGVKPIVGADAVAELTQPDGAVVTLDLRDDGEAPDETAEDGVYTGVLGDYAQDGVYDVEVVINNLEGRAEIKDGHAHSLGPEGEAVPSPPFQRVVRSRAEVVGVAGKQAPASSPEDPVEVAPDGTLHWGSIERLGQVNWYGFSATEGTNYWLQTSNLFGHDGVRMATELTLYEHDAATEIDSSVHYEQTDVSSIEWTAPADGTYLVSVAHANEGRGIYGLTLSRRSLLTAASISRAQNVGGGGSVGWLFLLSLLAASSAAFLAGRESHGRRPR